MFDHLHRAFPDPLPITNDIILAARSLLAQYSWISPRDAIHAAIVLVHELEGIISTDRGFDDMVGLTRFDPKDMM